MTTSLAGYATRVHYQLGATAPAGVDHAHRAAALEDALRSVVHVVATAAERDARGVAHLDGCELLAQLEGALASDVRLRLVAGS